MMWNRRLMALPGRRRRFSRAGNGRGTNSIFVMSFRRYFKATATLCLYLCAAPTAFTYPRHALRSCPTITSLQQSSRLVEHTLNGMQQQVVVQVVLEHHGHLMATASRSVMAVRSTARQAPERTVLGVCLVAGKNPSTCMKFKRCSSAAHWFDARARRVVSNHGVRSKGSPPVQRLTQDHMIVCVPVHRGRSWILSGRLGR